MIVGVGTEVIQGEGLIMTAGAIDACAYFTSPDVVTEALMSGVTTMIGGGTGMNGSVTMSTPGPNHIKYMIQATDDYPMNFGFYGKGNTSKAEGLSKELEDQIVAGAIGFVFFPTDDHEAHLSVLGWDWMSGGVQHPRRSTRVSVLPNTMTSV